MVKRVRSWTDLILGGVMLLISLYLLFAPDAVQGMVILYTNISAAKPETYLNILGVVLSLLSLALIIRSFGVFQKKIEEKTSAERKKPEWMIICSFVVLLLYMPMMGLLGFTVASMLLVTFFTFIIRFREKKVNYMDKKMLLKNLAVSIFYAAILVIVLQFSFTRWLHVRLP